jgi:Spy/CpxP family protein refolding chaperone
MEMLTEALTLTPEQSAKIKPLVERDREKIAALRDDQSLSQEDRRTKMREISRSRMEEIRAILTPEQQEKFKSVMEKRRAEWEKRQAERENK